jgi:DNA-binding transcriptional MerR regulator
MTQTPEENKRKRKVEDSLPPIPDKQYFTISEVGDLCGVKPHVLRYWEQEFSQLKPAKRRGNRRYYQHKDVLMIRQIRTLLYDKGFTIEGARTQLTTDKEVIKTVHADATVKKILVELENLLLSLKSTALI